MIVVTSTFTQEVEGILPLGAGNPERNPIIRFLPPLSITKSEIDKVFVRFKRALYAAAKEKT